MLFELITEGHLDTQELYERTHISAVPTGKNTYTISAEEAEAHRGADELEKFMRNALRDLGVAYLSLNLVNIARMVEFQPS